MANLIHRFLRNQSCLKAIPKITPNLITHHKSCIDTVKSLPPAESALVPLTNPVLTVAGLKSDESLHFYPSFPIGYGFNPAVAHDSDLIEAVVEEKGAKEETVIYADSVKKKRKKKMNKHKYKKLRKKTKKSRK